VNYSPEPPTKIPSTVRPKLKHDWTASLSITAALVIVWLSGFLVAWTIWGMR
jgi:hypothetical protein